MSERVKISKSLMAVNALFSLLGGLLTGLVHLWMVQFLIKRVDPADYSLLPVVMAVMMFLPIVSVVFTTGIARFTTAAYALGDEDEVTRISTTMFVMVLGLTAALLPVCGLLVYYVGPLLSIDPSRVQEARWMLGLLLGSFLISLPLAPLRVGLFVHQAFILQNALTFARSVLHAIVLLVLLLGVGQEVLWVVVAQVVGEVAYAIAETVASVRKLPLLRPRREHLDWRQSREILGFGVWSAVGRTATVLYAGTDPLVLQHMATSADVNTYHVGHTTNQYVRRFIGLMSAALYPALTAMHAHHQDARLRDAFIKGTRVIFSFVLALSVPLIVLRDEVMRVYLGPQLDVYPDAPDTMALLLAGNFFFYAVHMLWPVAAAKAEIRRLTIMAVIQQATNVVLTIILVRGFDMGVLGAALATFLVAAIMMPLMYWPLAMEMVNVSWRRWLREAIWPAVLPATTGAAAWWGLRGWVEPTQLTTLAAVVMGGGMVFLLTAAAILQPSDRADLKRVVAKVRERLRR